MPTNEQTIDIKLASEIELKAFAFDLTVVIKESEQKINMILNELAERERVLTSKSVLEVKE